MRGSIGGRILGGGGGRWLAVDGDLTGRNRGHNVCSHDDRWKGGKRAQEQKKEEGWMVKRQPKDSRGEKLKKWKVF